MRGATAVQSRGVHVSIRGVDHNIDEAISHHSRVEKINHRRGLINYKIHLIEYLGE